MAIEYITRAQVSKHIDEIEYPRLPDNSIDEERIAETMTFPRKEIEPYLIQGGYVVPVILQEDIDQMINIVLPIFKYYMTNNNGNRTDEITEGYNNAKSILNKIASGKTTLNIENDISNSAGSELNFFTLDVF